MFFFQLGSAQISNQWFADSKKVLELGIAWFNNNFKEPINQFIYFADIYSLAGDSSIFYKNTKGDLTSYKVPIKRNNQGFINEMELCDTTYTFELDNIGNVIGIEKSTLTTTEELEINDRFSMIDSQYSLTLPQEY